MVTRIATTEKSSAAIAAADERSSGVLPKPCEKCGGSNGSIIWFNGRKYWQCTSPAKEVLASLESGKGVDNERAKCGFWSTKTMKADE